MLSLVRRCRQSLRDRRHRRMREQVRRNRAMAAAFTASRSPQSDDDFVHACFAHATDVEHRRCLGVRWAVARVGRVSPQWIHAEDRFADLMALPGWCSRYEGIYFDPLRFILLVELALGVVFRDRDLERSQRFDESETLRVQELTVWFVNLCQRQEGR